MSRVPGERCGYEHRGGWGSPHCCLREPWREYDRCIWHATGSGDEPIEKPVSALRRARKSDPSLPSDGEYLDGASLSGTNLGDISFDGCSLIGADFSGANLAWEPHPIDVPWAAYLTENSEIPYDAITAPTFRDADLRASSFRACNLPWSDFRRADFRGADLEDCGFAYAWLQAANLRSANCRDAYLGRAKLHSAAVLNADFTDAVLSKAWLPKVRAERANFTRTDLSGALLVDAELFAAVFVDTKIGPDTVFGDRCFEDPENDAASTRVAQTDVTVHHAVEDEAVKALWTYRRLEELCRENALSSPAHRYYLRRKELRRGYAWASVPDWLRTPIATLARALPIFRPLEATWPVAATRPTAEDDTGAGTGTQTGTGSEYTRTREWDGEGRNASDEPGDIERRAVADDTASFGASSSVRDRIGRYVDRAGSDEAGLAVARGTDAWIGYLLYGVTMRYGESVTRVIGTSFAIILLFGILYPVAGIHGQSLDGVNIVYRYLDVQGSGGVVVDGFGALLEGLYFSAVTFTTLGYGDLQPIGVAKVLSTVEALFGGLLMALLVFVLGRRATF